jgi:Transglycosylase SLT domain
VDLRRYIKSRLARKIVTRVGAAKLLAVGVAVGVALLLFLALLATFAGASTDSELGAPNVCSTQPAHGKESGPPQELVPVYIAAAEKYHLGPRGPSILAAINYVETDFGRSPLPGVRRGTTNSAGAAGPMQFLYPSSWEMFGIDGNGDGVRDVYDSTDAIFSAANLLHAAGAPDDWYAAIFSYNHAGWYVEKVERFARSYGQLQCGGPQALGTLPSVPVQRLEYVARWIESQHLPYCWGGGHGEKPGPSPGDYCWSSDGHQEFGTGEKGLDCSGSVRWLLYLAGYGDTGPITSGQFEGKFLPGVSAAFTIWANAEHVFVTIGGAAWTTSESNFRHGPAFHEHSTAGFVARHLEGL